MNQKKRPVTISLCVIAKNEEEFIASCLDSARPFVDEMIVVDTGSSDRTVELATQHGARVEHFTWCDDFAAARNAAIEQATSDWILMLDADEQLEPESGPLLRPYTAQLPANVIAFAVVIENRKRKASADDLVRSTMTRFFPRRASLRYTGAIHEDLVDLDKPNLTEVVTASEIRVAHYGYDPALYAARDKDARNTRILEVAHARDPHNARILFYLGQQCYVAKRYTQAVRWLEQFVEVADQTPRIWLPEAYQMWVDALVHLNDGPTLAHVSAQAERQDVLSAVARETLARYELERGHPGVALRHTLAALSPQAPIGITVPDGTGGWRTRLLLARTYQELHETESALGELEHAYAIAPAGKYVEISTTAAEYALRSGVREVALTWAVRATQAAPDDIDVHDLLLDLKLRVLRRGALSESGDVFAAFDNALALQDWQASYDAGMQLTLGKADALARVLYLAKELRQREAPEAALNLLSRTLDVYPPTPRLYWPLIQTLKDLDRVEDALMAVEVLQKLEAG